MSLPLGEPFDALFELVLEVRCERVFSAIDMSMVEDDGGNDLQDGSRMEHSPFLFHGDSVDETTNRPSDDDLLTRRFSCPLSPIFFRKLPFPASSRSLVVRVVLRGVDVDW
jgi:hypothetical protein